MELTGMIVGGEVVGDLVRYVVEGGWCDGPSGWTGEGEFSVPYSYSSRFPMGKRIRIVIDDSTDGAAAHPAGDAKR